MTETVNHLNVVQEIQNAGIDKKLIEAVQKYPCLWELAKTALQKPIAGRK